MKTDDLISMLATNVLPVDPHVIARRIGTSVLIGSLSASLLVVMLLGIRHDIAQVSVTPLSANEDRATAIAASLRLFMMFLRDQVAATWEP